MKESSRALTLGIFASKVDGSTARTLTLCEGYSHLSHYRMIFLFPIPPTAPPALWSYAQALLVSLHCCFLLFPASITARLASLHCGRTSIRMLWRKPTSFFICFELWVEVLPGFIETPRRRSVFGDYFSWGSILAADEIIVQCFEKSKSDLCCCLLTWCDCCSCLC